MCLPLFFGKRDWDKPYRKDPEGRYGHVYCPNCRNFSVGPVCRREFVTLCMVPLIPLYWGQQLRCGVCNWRQDFKNTEQLEKVLVEQTRLRGGGI
ncbi:uncharacterized protein Ecym_7439 [Eremothecium cymbalariae DBVPG|uniref:Zinc-ribbon 15 domain-containing protein n=1 Tax=Eremothecium cymbalariae (strain CBS 270.75 / DBVPG 7215 / KCTC 17166 / NRRL Y-17582) TaxID=931890 RepID=G8JWP4_ERECY|nr:hypothetical protein Ecym_7439 [Eremothecium cymbalariae DBVPG\